MLWEEKKTPIVSLLHVSEHLGFLDEGKGGEKGGEQIREMAASVATTKGSANVLFEDVLFSNSTFQWSRNMGGSKVLMLCCNTNGGKRNKWNICIETEM